MYSFPQQHEQPDDASGQNGVAESGDVRQEADIAAVNLQHPADRHGSDGNEETQVIYDIPGSKRLRLMHLEQLGKN
ncbi:hypothetical protein D3C77_549990 [compost metagenome]